MKKLTLIVLLGVLGLRAGMISPDGLIVSAHADATWVLGGPDSLQAEAYDSVSASFVTLGPVRTGLLYLYGSPQVYSNGHAGYAGAGANFGAYWLSAEYYNCPGCSQVAAPFTLGEIFNVSATAMAKAFDVNPDEYIGWSRAPYRSADLTVSWYLTELDGTPVPIYFAGQSDPSEIPEPSTWALVATGTLAALARKRLTRQP